MRAKLLIAFLALLTGMFFSNCATIVSKSSYPIILKTTPTGARVTVTNQKGIDVYKGNTPAIVRLKPGGGYFRKATYRIKFQMEGYEDRVVTVNSGFNGWYVGNIIFGGFIGFLIVDPLTGAMYKIKTPYINETLQPGTKSASNIPTLEIYPLSEVPESWKKDMVRIN